MKLKLIWPNQTLNMIQMKRTSNGRQPQISKVKYLFNHWSYPPQTWNLSLYDQTKIYIWFKWRGPPIEDDLKYQKWNIFQSLVRSSPNLKLKLIWPNETLHMIQMKRTSNGTRPQISKEKNLFLITGQIFPKFET